MRFYPQLSGPRTRTILCDVGVLVLVALFAWTGKQVHDTVVEINSLSRGVIDAGSSVQNGFEDAAGAVGDVPVVGGSLADGLRSAGGASGGNVVAAGEAGKTAVNDTANVLGLAIFGLPTLVLLAFFVPRRGLQIRRLILGAQALDPAPSAERRRLLAERAAFGCRGRICARSAATRSATSRLTTTSRCWPRSTPTPGCARPGPDDTGGSRASTQSSSGNEWCSCATTQRPSALRNPSVSRRRFSGFSASS
jgi:hypothetical protein